MDAAAAAAALAPGGHAAAPVTVDARAELGDEDAAAARPQPRQVLVLAPVGRDATLAIDALAAAGIPARAVDSAAELLDVVSAEVVRDGPPELGAVLVTDDALGIDWSGRLVGVLERQPPWSDLPIVLLAGMHTSSEPWLPPGEGGALAARLTARGSVTVLDRPVRVAALVSAVTAALRARGRQAEVRDLIESRDRALADAERANRAKSAFLALMSHELRTPLNAISGYVQLINDGIYGSVTSKQHEALRRVTRAQEHLLAIISDLLDFARIESGRIEYRVAPLSLESAVSEAVSLVEGQLATRDLACVTRLPGAPIHVSADAEKLRQILLNLLSNAAKFTAPGGRITIEAERVPTDGAGRDLARIRVRDTGIGIPADKLEAIFEPFVQAHRDRFLDGPQGTGLGLPISRKLARGMGGDLTAAGEPGRGSTFTLVLPCAGEPSSGR